MVIALSITGCMNKNEENLAENGTENNTGPEEKTADSENTGFRRYMAL